jgi:hypothetical protein
LSRLFYGSEMLGFASLCANLQSLDDADLPFAPSFNPSPFNQSSALAAH